MKLRTRPTGIRGTLARRRARAQRTELIERARTQSKRWAPWAAAGSALAGLIAIVTRPRSRAAIARRARATKGKLRGVAYRLRRGKPAPDVDEDVLVDRIRSTIGPLEKRLDVPRVHVMMHNGFAVLHGSVGTRAEASQIEQSVAGVSGVHGVESHLHVGLTAVDTRPSEGRKRFRAIKIGRIGQREHEPERETTG